MIEKKKVTVLTRFFNSFQKEQKVKTSAQNSNDIFVCKNV